MELTMSPICGRSYANMDSASYLDDGFFANLTDRVSPPARGCCWNALTRCLILCDPARACLHAVRVEINSDTQQVSVLGSGGGGFPLGGHGNAPGKFMLPAAVDVNLRGDIAVADAKLNRIQVFSGSGQLRSYFGKTGAGRGEFRGLSDLKFTPQGHIAVVDTENHRVVVLTATGGLVAIVGRHGWRLGQLTSPCALDISQSGDMFVLDHGNKRVQRFNAKGRLLAVWGGYRDPHTMAEEATEATGFGSFPASQIPPLTSCFRDPCDLGVGANGEVMVCDAALQQLMVFSDVGECLHVAKSAFHSSKPIGVTKCGRLALVVTCSVSEPRLTIGPSNTNSNPRKDTGPIYSLVIFPAPLRVQAGKTERWPVKCVERVICFLTYQDAIHIRLVNRLLHRVCRSLRNAWMLYPLTTGQAAARKYNRKATGLAAVHEAFDKWGLRVYKPSNRVRRHVMDFSSGFCGALRSFHTAMFLFEHEEVLKQLFLFHANSSTIDKAEIGREAFVEIATQIEEVRFGLMAWSQCPAFQGDRALNFPKVRMPDQTISRHDAQLERLLSLQLFENAQQHQLGKLLRKLQAM